MRKRLRTQVFDTLGNRCASPTCQWINADGSRGCTDPRCLQIDHKKGGGYQAMKKAGNNYNHLKEIAADPEIHEHYQLLCANCNWIKRHENKEFNRVGSRRYHTRYKEIADTVVAHPEMTYPQIGKQFGVCETTVRVAARTFGVSRGRGFKAGLRFKAARSPG
jgi:hypothetical protein